MTEHIPRQDADLFTPESVHQTFVSAVQPERTAHESDIDKTMSDLSTLGQGFASAMVELQMPVDSFVHEAKAEGSEDIIRTVYPGWLVLQGTDLSGKSMISVLVGNETYSRSLGSGTPNNFRTNWRKVSRSELEEMTDRDYDGISYNEHAVALSADGNWLPLEKSFFHRKHGKNIKQGWRWEDYKVNPARTLQAKDFFDTERSVIPSHMTTKMTTELKNTQSEYEKKRRLQIEREGLVVPNYEVERVFIPATPPSSIVRTRGFFGKLLGN